MLKNTFSYNKYMRCTYELSLVSFHTFLYLFNNCLIYKIDKIINEMQISKKKMKQLNIYLNACKYKNDNLFLNSSEELQYMVVTLFLNCLSPMNEQEKKLLSEIYGLVLDKLIDKNIHEGGYIEYANILKQIYELNEEFINFKNCSFDFMINDIKNIKIEIYDNENLDDIIYYNDDDDDI